MKVPSTAAARISGSPSVQRAVDRARQAARDTASRLPHPADQKVSLRATDFTGIRTTGLLLDGAEARLARKAARRLGLPRTLDDTSAWAAFGALAALLRIVDDGSRRSVVVDTAGPRSVFTRWATKIGFAPVHVDVMRAEVVGTDVDPGSVDLVVRLHPHSSDPQTVDEDLARGASALRRGGLIIVTLRLGTDDAGGVGVADLRSLIARADEQGLSLIGDIPLEEGRQARAVAEGEPGNFGLALLTFRRR
ncbi:hypothetical protein HJ588_13075 [Flexivirga sp. ID2601S]|uniref:Class I SAM-dependent methyltransferase n=1 Tax=Flexivirga aerilata TaxID=1656889 RepID=A0A849ALL2_9MICO|nr:hypothetical protein [Flexivirga aerilata]NNG40198.1 hypothetical protein [Flexivirga aerilata]